MRGARIDGLRGVAPERVPSKNPGFGTRGNPHWMVRQAYAGPRAPRAAPQLHDWGRLRSNVNLRETIVQYGGRHD
jgi:hypothetical protein